MSYVVWGQCAREVAVEAGFLVSTLVAPFGFLCYDGYFREYRDHTDSTPHRLVNAGACDYKKKKKKNSTLAVASLNYTPD